jgi:hypothetical protein
MTSKKESENADEDDQAEVANSQWWVAHRQPPLL